MIPAPVRWALASRNAAFYRYDLGGFIDHEWLWRIDADREVVARLARGLGLGPGPVPSRRFWRMPPLFWPGAMPSGGVALQSVEFRAEARGPDGEHYNDEKSNGRRDPGWRGGPGCAIVGRRRCR